MRRVEHGDSERGVVAPITALLLVVLLGMAAFAVDVATMYSEHAQLQNGADASALAIAQACAASPPGPDCSDPEGAASSMSNGNALDSHSNVVSATVGSGVVDVTTQSQDSEGNNHFSLVFARVLGNDTADIGASSQAIWGAFSAIDGIPLTFSQCEADPSYFAPGELLFFPTHGSALSEDPDYECEHQSASGHELPGGFGWLNDPDGGCKMRLDITDPWVEARPGNSVDSACAPMFDAWEAKLEAGEAVEVLIPIFDTACPSKGTGVNPCADAPSAKGKYFRIEAFAQISIKGWHLNGGGTSYFTSEAEELEDSLKLKNSDEGIYGTFVKKVTLAEAAVLGGPATYGALGVQLSK
jgi:hypothetical protein